LGEITVDLRLVFKIPDSGLTMNGLIQGLKKKALLNPHGTIISTLMKAIEERIAEQKLSQEPQRYKPNGHQSKPRKLRSSFGTISYRFAQLADRKENRTFAPWLKSFPSLPMTIFWRKPPKDPWV
jgi:hypothetical protein